MEKKILPKIIIHNSISIDGSLTDFKPNMVLHYQIARSYKPDAHLIGSNTVRVGIELYGTGVPPEERKDFEKSKRDAGFPYWVIPDTEGALKGLLHTCRRFEFCKDVVVLISEKTPEDYVEYLKERKYDYYVVGKKHVNLKKSLELLSTKYNVKKVLADTGRIMSNLLLNQDLASEISLLIHPIIVGNRGYTIFGNINNAINLRLQKKKTLYKRYIWLVYSVN
jgi:2,5-diamino-6-(ribosylamino)-4(3H)-pyrimidinone 5'-phosphate reductase